jgi:imidazolonepropionase-like amidohydrolase
MKKHLLAVILLLGWTHHPALSQTAPKQFALSGVTLIDALHIQPAYRQTVVINDGMVVRIFPDGAQSLPDSIPVLRLQGKYILPGLIDTHVHLATEPSTTNNRVSTLSVLDRMLRSGITSVRDMAGDARTLAGLSRDALIGDIPSPDIYFSALMAGPSFFKDPRTITSAMGGVSGYMPYMRAVTDTTNLTLAVAEAKGTGATGIKLYADLPAPLVSRIVATAKEQGILVWGHAWLNPARPSDLVKAGVSSISHAPLLIRETRASIPPTWKRPRLDDRFLKDSLPDLSALFQLMKKYNVLLDATMATYRQWAEQDTSMGYNYDITKRCTAMAYLAGVKICAGTDDDQQGFVQNEMELLVHDAGLTPGDAIIAATLHGAEALGIDKTCGTIAPGKRANLMVLDKDPLVDIRNIRSVVLVIKAGKVYSSIL